MMLKKRSTDFSAKKKQCSRRVVECLFSSKDEPKKWVFIIDLSDSNYEKGNVRCLIKLL